MVLKLRDFGGLEGKGRVGCNLRMVLGIKWEESESFVDCFIGDAEN